MNREVFLVLIFHLFAMHVLIIHPALPPVANAEGICTAKVIQALSKIGVKITVITSSEHNNISDVKYIVVPGLTTGTEPIFEKLARLYHRYPESGWAWAKSASEVASKLITSASVDVVYTRAMPFLSHIVGYYINRPVSVPWIAHFSDPWPADSYFGPKRNKWRYLWHRRIIKSTDGVTFPCLRVAEFCQEQQWQGNSPRAGISFVSPHVFPTLSIMGRTRDSSSDGRVVFLHSGSFFGDRIPDILVKGWCQFVSANAHLVGKVVLRHVGTESARFTALAEEAGLGETVEQVGPCSYESSLEKMANADVLVLVESTARTSIYFPSKLVDYLWIGRPIVALVSQDSTVGDFLSKDYALRADPWDSASVKMVFEQSMTCFKTRQEPILGPLREIFAPEKVALGFVNFAETLTRAKRSCFLVA